MSVCAHGQVFTQPYCWHAAKAELEDYPIPVLEDFAQADRVEGPRVVRGYSLLLYKFAQIQADVRASRYHGVLPLRDSETPKGVSTAQQ